MAPEIRDSRRHCSVCQQSTWHSATRTRFWEKYINTLSIHSYVCRGIKIGALKMLTVCIFPHLLNICRKFEFLISQGSVATSLRWGGYCCLSFIANFTGLPAVHKFWKSIKIWQSYREFKGGNFFETQCRRKFFHLWQVFEFNDCFLALTSLIQITTKHVTWSQNSIFKVSQTHTKIKFAVLVISQRQSQYVSLQLKRKYYPMLFHYSENKDVSVTCN